MLYGLMQTRLFHLLTHSLPFSISQLPPTPFSPLSLPIYSPLYFLLLHFSRERVSLFWLPLCPWLTPHCLTQRQGLRCILKWIYVLPHCLHVDSRILVSSLPLLLLSLTAVASPLSLLSSLLKRDIVPTGRSSSLAFLQPRASFPGLGSAPS